MLAVAAITYLTMLFGSIFGLAFSSGRKPRPEARLAETARSERARDLRTP
jgi:hypothetical protein